MSDFTDFFKQNPNGVFGTIDNAVPKARMFQCLWSEGNKIFFCTASSKQVSKQLKANPKASFCAFKPDFSETVTAIGSVTFVDDMQGKQRVLDENPVIKGIYKDASNPEFEMFYIDVEEVESFSFAHGPKYVKF